jgi:hypothetical protein
LLRVKEETVLPTIKSNCCAGNPYDHFADCGARSLRTGCRTERAQNTIEGHACARPDSPGSIRTTGVHKVVRTNDASALSLISWWDETADVGFATRASAFELGVQRHSIVTATLALQPSLRTDYHRPGIRSPTYSKRNGGWAGALALVPAFRLGTRLSLSGAW